METVPDRIEKKIVLRAPIARVWRAISDARQFGTWFGVAFEGEFVPGTTVRGKMVPTAVDPDVARAQEPYAGMPFDCMVERMEPERLFSFRWHPCAVEPGVDYTQEPTTLVELALTAVPDGTLLTVTESGFDKVPPERRVQAFRMNEEGWIAQLELVRKYLASAG